MARSVTAFWKSGIDWPTRRMKCVSQMFKRKFMAHITLYYIRRQLKEQRCMFIGEMPCTIRLSTAHQSISKNDQNAWFINRQLLEIKFQNIIIGRSLAHIWWNHRAETPIIHINLSVIASGDQDLLLLDDSLSLVCPSAQWPFGIIAQMHNPISTSIVRRLRVFCVDISASQAPCAAIKI